MLYSRSPSDALGSQEDYRYLSPVILYHLRKMLRQNFDRLTSTTAQESPMHAPLSDLNAVLENLYLEEQTLQGIVQKLERLVLLHQSLTTQGTQHPQRLRETEAQIFGLLGFRVDDHSKRGTILLVDDVTTELNILAAYLKQQTFRVMTALEGQTALALAREHKPNLILLDIRMPGMNGYEICQQLKQDPTTQDIPILFISGVYDAQERVKAFEVGGVDFISKPFQVEEVLARVQHQLKLHDLQKRLEEQNVRFQQEIQERRELQDRYRRLFENSIDGMFQSTPGGQYISVNPALAAIYGYASPEELMTQVTHIGQQLYLQASRYEGIHAYLQQHGRVLGAESRIRRKDGSKIWISENVRVVKDAQGKVLYYEGTVRDITERRKLESVLHHQKKHTDRILQSVLPRSVAERLKYTQQTIADRFDEVSVLFADIDNFTAFSSRISPTEQVQFLNRLFCEFDQLTEQLGLEKIKTIRDVYLVASGMPEPREDHADAIAEMAIQIQAAAAAFQHQLGEPFQVRVGISSGSVVAGVVGSKKFTYDLWGDPVNLASRMQSSGTPGRIQVTPATYRRLQHRYDFEERGLIEVQGVGMMMTYWLQGRKSGSGEAC
ncbi:MAG: adenylate/guanylate cyclase domain-containing protein [Synechococcales bacterium]|nr:adenylate/guanylate cyclase domain-containing protein [Synechococcales bacterium]